MSTRFTCVFTLLVEVLTVAEPAAAQPAASSTTQELAMLIPEDYSRYGKLIKDAGIKGE